MLRHNEECEEQEQCICNRALLYALLGVCKKKKNWAIILSRWHKKWLQKSEPKAGPEEADNALSICHGSERLGLKPQHIYAKPEGVFYASSSVKV